MTPMRLLLPVLAGLGLAGCAAGPPVPVAVPPAPPAAEVQPAPRQRVWVRQRCDPGVRCSGGSWRWL